MSEEAKLNALIVFLLDPLVRTCLIYCLTFFLVVKISVQLDIMKLCEIIKLRKTRKWGQNTQM
jgi:hypothetical protein